MAISEHNSCCLLSAHLIHTLRIHVHLFSDEFDGEALFMLRGKFCIKMLKLAPEF
jgi:hypothetical protein